jgi:hypothetical protein
MIRTLIAFLLVVVALTSCSQEPTLQKYYVEKSGKPSFSTFDIAPTIINSRKLSLSAEEQKALESLHKFNILIYQKDAKKPAEYDAEKDKVKTLLKNDKYEELMKFNAGGMGASISTKGEGENIDEFVVFVNNKETGFGVVRVLGEDMTPNNVLTIASLIQKAGINPEQLKPLQQLVSKPQPYTQPQEDVKVEVKE